MRNNFREQGMNIIAHHYFRTDMEDRSIFGDNLKRVKYMSAISANSGYGIFDYRQMAKLDEKKLSERDFSEFNATNMDNNGRAVSNRQSVTSSKTHIIRGMGDLQSLLKDNQSGQVIDSRTSQMSPEVIAALQRGEPVEVSLEQLAPERVNLITPLLASVMQIMGGAGGAAYNEELSQAITGKGGNDKGQLGKAADFVSRHGNSFSLSPFGGGEHIDVVAHFRLLNKDSENRKPEDPVKVLPPKAPTPKYKDDKKPTEATVDEIPKPVVPKIEIGDIIDSKDFKLMKTEKGYATKFDWEAAAKSSNVSVPDLQALMKAKGIDVDTVSSKELFASSFLQRYNKSGKAIDDIVANDKIGANTKDGYRDTKSGDTINSAVILDLDKVGTYKFHPAEKGKAVTDYVMTAYNSTEAFDDGMGKFTKPLAADTDPKMSTQDKKNWHALVAKAEKTFAKYPDADTPAKLLAIADQAVAKGDLTKAGEIYSALVLQVENNSRGNDNKGVHNGHLGAGHLGAEQEAIIDRANKFVDGSRAIGSLVSASGFNFPINANNLSGALGAEHPDLAEQQKGLGDLVTLYNKLNKTNIDPSNISKDDAIKLLDFSDQKLQQTKKALEDYNHKDAHPNLKVVHGQIDQITGNDKPGTGIKGLSDAIKGTSPVKPANEEDALMTEASTLSNVVSKVNQAAKSGTKLELTASEEEVLTAANVDVSALKSGDIKKLSAPLGQIETKLNELKGKTSDDNDKLIDNLIGDTDKHTGIKGVQSFIAEKIAYVPPTSQPAANQNEADEYIGSLKTTVDMVISELKKAPPAETIIGEDGNPVKMKDFVNKIEDDFKNFLLSGFKFSQDENTSITSIANAMSGINTLVGAKDFDNVRSSFALAAEATDNADLALALGEKTGQSTLAVNSNPKSPEYKQFTKKLVDGLPESGLKQYITQNFPDGGATDPKKVFSLLSKNISNLSQETAKQFFAIAERLLKEALPEGSPTLDKMNKLDLTGIFDASIKQGKSVEEAFKNIQQDLLVPGSTGPVQITGQLDATSEVKEDKGEVDPTGAAPTDKTEVTPRDSAPADRVVTPTPPVADASKAATTTTPSGTPTDRREEVKQVRSAANQVMAKLQESGYKLEEHPEDIQKLMAFRDLAVQSKSRIDPKLIEVLNGIEGTATQLRAATVRVDQARGNLRSANEDAVRDFSAQNTSRREGCERGGMDKEKAARYHRKKEEYIKAIEASNIPEEYKSILIQAELSHQRNLGTPGRGVGEFVRHKQFRDEIKDAIRSGDNSRILAASRTYFGSDSPQFKSLSAMVNSSVPSGNVTGVGALNISSRSATNNTGVQQQTGANTGGTHTSDTSQNEDIAQELDRLDASDVPDNEAEEYENETAKIAEDHPEYFSKANFLAEQASVKIVESTNKFAEANADLTSAKERFRNLITTLTSPETKAAFDNASAQLQQEADAEYETQANVAATSESTIDETMGKIAVLENQLADASNFDGSAANIADLLGKFRDIIKVLDIETRAVHSKSRSSSNQDSKFSQQMKDNKARWERLDSDRKQLVEKIGKIREEKNIDLKLPDDFKTSFMGKYDAARTGS